MATTGGEACSAARRDPTREGLHSPQHHFGLSSAAAAAAAAAAWNQHQQQQQQQQHGFPHSSYSGHHQDHHQFQHHQHQPQNHQTPQQLQHQSPGCWYGGSHLDFSQQAAAAAVFGFHCYSTSEAHQQQQQLSTSAPTQQPLAQPPLPHQQHQPHQSGSYRSGSPLHCSSPSGIQWLEEAKAISQTLSQETIRDLEQFAEAFKQRRVKLGFTQADVGRDIAQLNVAGMGSLSQSTICRFESLTLSHNNMLALRPILEQWLLHAEQQHQARLCSGLREAKRRRTSIAMPERRSLEAYFAVQSRPSSDKIGDIAQKLSLKKSVVRVWFCNQRQKQKRINIGNCPPAVQPPPARCAAAAASARLLPLPPGAGLCQQGTGPEDFQAAEEVDDFGGVTDEDSGPAAPL